MFKIIDYDDKYDEMLRQLDELTFLNVKYHGDVINSSACLLFNDNTLIGAGFLKKGATFLEIEKRELPYYFVHAEYTADPEADAAIQIEASGLLLEELKKRFDSLQGRYKDKRLILRLWCGADKSAYLEFLISYGFRPMRVIPIMIRQLSDEDNGNTSSKIAVKGIGSLQVKEADPGDDRFMEEYLLTNAEAFEVADSANELRFVSGGSDSHVYAVMEGKRVIAAVTTWKISDRRAATENIFCAKDYRRKGITFKMLEYVFGRLRADGYKEASLTVFGDNQPAQQLYLKLGYEVEGSMLECHYEKEYHNIGY